MQPSKKQRGRQFAFAHHSTDIAALKAAASSTAPNLSADQSAA